MPEVVILGAAGHAKVIIEILQETSNLELTGCLSPEADNASVCGIPVLGDDSKLEPLFQRGVHHAFVAIGQNRLRATLSERLQRIGFRLVNAISKHAVLSPSVRLGSGIAIMPGAILNADTVVGDGSIINTGATVDHDCHIGPFSHIAPGCNLAGGVTIGRGGFLGIGSHVIPSVTIGEWTTVGAGGIVIRNLPAQVTAVGVPARVRNTER